MRNTENELEEGGEMWTRRLFLRNLNMSFHYRWSRYASLKEAREPGYFRQGLKKYGKRSVNKPKPMMQTNKEPFTYYVIKFWGFLDPYPPTCNQMAIPLSDYRNCRLTLPPFYKKLGWSFKRTKILTSKP